METESEKMTYWVKTHTAGPDNLSLIPWTHVVEGENKRVH